MASIAVCANNGDIGGGEVMQLSIAQAARDLGHDVTVVGPAEPADLVDAAERSEFTTVRIPGAGRTAYIPALRRWTITSSYDVMWANGLVPALATTGQANRIVHLHRLPDTPAQRIAAVAAVRRAAAVVVPSAFMADRLTYLGRRRLVMPNWTESIEPAPSVEGSALRIGFLGRVTRDKGIHVLADAMHTRPEIQGREVRLVVGGERRFAADDEVVDQALARLGSRVDYLGWVDRNQFFSEVDLAVFPSVWPEPFGLVAAEAMAAQVPFVISDAGALPEVVGRDYPWVAPAGDPVALARVITEVGTDPERSAATVIEQRARWERQFSPTSGRGRVAALLGQIGVVS